MKPIRFATDEGVAANFMHSILRIGLLFRLTDNSTGSQLHTMVDTNGTERVVPA